MIIRRVAPAVGLVCFLSLLPLATLSQTPPRTASTSDTPPEDAYLTLTIRALLSPYDSVQYEIRARGRTLLVSLSKTLRGGYGDLQDVGLLSVEELPRLLQELDECGLELTETPQLDPDAAMTYALEVQRGEVQQQFIWTAGDNRPGTPFWCAARLVMDTYDASGDPVLFQDLFWDEGDYGELSTTSVPPARLFVDGRDTGLTTPVHNLRLEPGVHMLRYVNASLEIDREYDATIIAEHTTRIDVELR